MHRRRFLRRSGALVALALAGCAREGSGTDGGTRTGTPTPGETSAASGWETVTLSGPPCESIDGATFRSVEKQPGGPGPGGTPARAYWRVSFEDGRFEYSHADLGESGPYACSHEDDVARLTGNRDDAPTLTGVYDPETGILEWERVRYHPVEREGESDG